MAGPQEMDEDEERRLDEFGDELDNQVWRVKRHTERLHAPLTYAMHAPYVIVSRSYRTSLRWKWKESDGVPETVVA